MKKRLFTNHQSLFFIALCLTFVFWLFFLVQTVSDNLIVPSEKAIPAFLNTNTVRIPISYFCDNDTDDLSDKQTIINYLKKYDQQIRLISCHKEKNYTDFYFYSPNIHQTNSSPLTEDFNLQAAVTQKYVYFGTPLIQYDF